MLDPIPATPSRRTLTPSPGVSILVLITAAILLGLTITLFLAAHGIDLKSGQRLGVRIGCIGLGILSLSGLIVATTDLILRIDRRRNTREGERLPYENIPTPSASDHVHYAETAEPMTAAPLLSTAGFAIEPQPEVAPPAPTLPEFSPAPPVTDPPPAPDLAPAIFDAPEVAASKPAPEPPVEPTSAPHHAIDPPPAPPAFNYSPAPKPPEFPLE